MMHIRRGLGVGAATATVIGLLLPAQTAVAATTCVFNDSGTTRSLAGDCTTDQTLTVPDGWTFDGNGHTITALAPFAGNAVLESEHGTTGNTPRSMTIGHVTIAGVPNGVDGILFDGAEGRVTHVTIQGGDNGVEADNSVGADFAAPTDLVKVGTTTISGYHHAGVYAHGDLKLNVLSAVMSSPGGASAEGIAGVWMEEGAHGSVKDSHIALSDAEPTTANVFGAGVRIEKDAAAEPRRVEVKRNVFVGGDADFGISITNESQTKILTADTNCNLFRRHDTSAEDPYGDGVARWQDTRLTNLLVSNSTFQGNWKHATRTIGTNSGPPNTLARSTSTCPPGAPRHVRANGGDHKIKVTWRRAIAPEYAPLTGYKVKAKAKGLHAVTKKVGPKATSAVLKGLKNNRRWVVTVTARSNGGKASATDRTRTG